MSAIAIQLIQWRPFPRWPPTPSRKGVSILASAPPRRSSTMPVRLMATRMPASRAGAVAASQSLHTEARKSSPALLVSSSTSSPRSP